MKEQKKYLLIPPTRKNIVYIITPQTDQDIIMKSRMDQLGNAGIISIGHNKLMSLDGVSAQTVSDSSTEGDG